MFVGWNNGSQGKNSLFCCHWGEKLCKGRVGSEPQGAGLDGTLGRKESFPGTDDSMDPTSLEVSKARLDTPQSKNQGMALANFGDQLHKEQLSASFGCGSTSPASQNFIPKCPAGKTERDPSIPAPQHCFQKEL